MKAIIETTNGLTLEGVCTFVGVTTIAIDVLHLTAGELTKLYEINASANQYTNHWRLQLPKKHIAKVTFND